MTNRQFILAALYVLAPLIGGVLLSLAQRRYRKDSPAFLRVRRIGLLLFLGWLVITGVILGTHFSG